MKKESKVVLTRPSAQVVALVALGVLLALPAGAQEHPADDPAEHEERAPHGEDARGHEEHGKNALGLILAGTYESEEEEVYFTWGFEYERLFTPRFALFLEVEHIEEVDAWLIAAPFVYRHASGWRLFAGPGLEIKPRRLHFDPEGEHRAGSESSGEVIDRLPRGNENLFLLRFGTSYHIPFAERYAAAPALGLDLVREEGKWVWAVVFGVSIGFHF